MGKKNLNSSNQSGHISVTRTQYDTLVFTTVKSSKEKMIYHKMPFNISVYNLWTDTWSFPYAEEEDSKTPMFLGRPHSLVSLNGSAFAAFKDVIGSRDHDVLSLWSVQGAASDSPVYSTTHVNCEKIRACSFCASTFWSSLSTQTILPELRTKCSPNSSWPSSSVCKRIR